MSPKNTFLLINICGGILVVGGYAIGLSLYPEYNEALWGGVQGTLRNLFMISMIPAALGYLTFCYIVIFKDSIEILSNKGFLGKNTVAILITLFLLSAACWMPTLIAYIHTQNTNWWLLSVLSLWITAISILILTRTIASTPTTKLSNASKTISVIGLAYITFHCLFVDAIVWVYMF
tara:strand:- start:2372 stop:2902 length:531 start_codon:yes stop_codon:yes gene_type:complete